MQVILILAFAAAVGTAENLAQAAFPLGGPLLAVTVCGMALVSFSSFPWRPSLGFALRCRLPLILGPVVILLALRDVVWLVWPDFATGGHAGLLLVPLLGLAVVGLPCLIRHAWRTRPLAVGPLRKVLQDDAGTWRTPARELLVWPTGHRVVAVAVTGLVPAVRYIVLSDALLGRLADDEVRAVVAHEAGHIHHGHLALRMMAIVTPALLLSAAGQVFGPTAGPPAAWLWWPDPVFGRLAALLLSLAAAGCTLLGFGPYCRLLEHQADVFACRGLAARGAVAVARGSAMSGPGTARFVAALEHLAAASGGSRCLTRWLYPSTARRVAFLEWLVRHPGIQGRFARRMRRLRWLTTGLFFAALGCLAWSA